MVLLRGDAEMSLLRLFPGGHGHFWRLIRQALWDHLLEERGHLQST